MAVPDSLPHTDAYLKQMELAGGRIDDALHRLRPRDRVWLLNAKLREELDAWPGDGQAAERESRSSRS
jgi:hypothetical protein